MTPQGQAIREAAVKFGDGETLCFTPCKKGYIPIINGVKMYACPLHNKQRQARVSTQGGSFRSGEVDLNIFWKDDSNLLKENICHTSQ